MTYTKHILTSTIVALLSFSPSYGMKKITVTVETEKQSALPRKAPTSNPFGITPLTNEDRKLTANALISRPRIQLFSLKKGDGIQACHNRLEKMRAQDERIAYYPALIASERNSTWNRGQIGPFANYEEAEKVAKVLRGGPFKDDAPCVSSTGWVHQDPQKFPLEHAEKHEWK